MKHSLLFYDVVDNYVERRAPFRKVHLEYAWASVARGELFLGGALTDPVDGAVFVFTADDRSVAENFAKNDPYVVNGLVKSWRVRDWLTAAGDAAATPIRPEDLK